MVSHCKDCVRLGISAFHTRRFVHEPHYQPLWVPCGAWFRKYSISLSNDSFSGKKYPRGILRRHQLFIVERQEQRMETSRERLCENSEHVGVSHIDIGGADALTPDKQRL